MRGCLLAALFVLAPWLAGCPVMQSQDTPVQQFQRFEPATRQNYWLYVPSYYSPQYDWPLVITLHGTHGFDSAEAQIREWKALAEEKGLIVAAPTLKSPQGILPVFESKRFEDLADDERTILGCYNDVRRNYRVSPKAVLLTGFSAGGYAMYYTGLRHPECFTALAARACNSDVAVFEAVNLTDAARKMPIIVIHGKDDLGPIGTQSWEAFSWLRLHRCFGAEHYKISGGHIRQPEPAWRYWSAHLPEEFRKRRDF